jgi:transposase
MTVNASWPLASRACRAVFESWARSQAGATPLVSKPLTSGAKAEGRFGKQDFVYIPADDVYRCPAGELLTWRFDRVEDGQLLRHYWTTACEGCAIKARCTTGKERRINRWEHESVIDAMQQRLDQAPDAMRIRRQTVEHPFGTIKAWMSATHFLTRGLKRVSTEMSLYVLAYNPAGRRSRASLNLISTSFARSGGFSTEPMFLPISAASC